MDLYEYQGKELFKRFGIPVSEGRVASTPDEARAAAEELGTQVVVKAQVLTGGRGKAGGIKLADSPDEAAQHAEAILGMDINGHVVRRLWIEQASDIEREYYLSITFDRGEKKALFMSGPRRRVASVESVSFARGVPAPECLALEELADCARTAIERDGATALNYGPAGGYAPLREWIADQHDVEPERVVLTNGSLQGFRFLAELLSPTGTVVVEAPTYDRPLKILAELEAEVICVPLDEEPAMMFALCTLVTLRRPSRRA